MYNAYEIVGSGMSRESKKAQDPERKARIDGYLKEYIDAPLFIVGFSSEMMQQLVFNDIDYEAVRLPYRHVIFDFPGLNNNLHEMNVTTVVDVKELSEDKLLVQFVAYLKSENLQENLEKRLAKSSASQKDKERAMKLMTNLISSDMVLTQPNFVITFDREQQKHFITNLVVANTNCAGRKTPYSLPGYSTIYSLSVCQAHCPERTAGCLGGNEITENNDKFALDILAVLSYINQPQQYIVKESPELTDKEKRQKGKGIVPSFSKKPKHIVLDYSQVKELVRSSSGNGHHASPVPHSRRGHWRRLESDYFKNKRRVYVRPADINKGMTWQARKAVYEIVGWGLSERSETVTEQKIESEDVNKLPNLSGNSGAMHSEDVKKTSGLRKVIEFIKEKILRLERN